MVGRTQEPDGSDCSGGKEGGKEGRREGGREGKLEGLKGDAVFITHCVARHRDKGAPHGRRDGHYVVDDAFVLGVGDICDVKDLTHGVRQALQTAAGLLGFGN